MFDIGFNEKAYLSANPDVAAAVKRGDLRSGWTHFILYGATERRPGAPTYVPSGLRKILETRTLERPIPPGKLRTRVHGEGSLESWSAVGKIISFNLLSEVERLNITLSPEIRILDFGCGVGRVITWLHALMPAAQFYGCDIDSEAIYWCERNLGTIGAFYNNALDPPLPYPDSSFDLVIAISVFTHLPEERQNAWLRELRRITSSNGHLLLSVQSEQLVPAGFAINPRGHTYIDRGATEGLPEFYRCAFHGDAYIRTRWRVYFSNITIVSRAINGHQDLVICNPN
jgi:SAM-dependent methyltransferase